MSDRPFCLPKPPPQGRVRGSVVTFSCKNKFHFYSSNSQGPRSPVISIIQLHSHSPVKASPSPVCRPHLHSAGLGWGGWDEGQCAKLVPSMGPPWPALASHLRYDRLALAWAHGGLFGDPSPPTYAETSALGLSVVDTKLCCPDSTQGRACCPGAGSPVGPRDSCRELPSKGLATSAKRAGSDRHFQLRLNPMGWFRLSGLYHSSPFLYPILLPPLPSPLQASTLGHALVNIQYTGLSQSAP